MLDLSLIPFTCSAGAKVPGTERGPLDLQESGITDFLSSAGVDAAWQTDPAALYDKALLPKIGSPERIDIVLRHCRALQDQVQKALADGKRPLTLGGDHSMAAGSVSGVAQALNARGRTGLLWLDAHADLNTPDTSPSRALHGMPVAALLGLAPLSGEWGYSLLAGKPPPLKPEHLAYVGLRDIDPGEQDFIDSLGITAFTMKDIERLGIHHVLHEAGRIVMNGTSAQVLSIDLDAFDPSEAPAVGSPVPGGLRAADTFPALSALVSEVDFDLIEIAEYNPTLAGRDATLSFMKDLLRTLFG